MTQQHSTHTEPLPVVVESDGEIATLKLRLLDVGYVASALDNAAMALDDVDGSDTHQVGVLYLLSQKLSSLTTNL